MSKANCFIGSSIRLGGLLPIFALALVFNAHAQTLTKFTTLHHFGGGGDGAAPHGTLVLSGTGTLYGTAPLGGIYKNGAVFALSTNGAGFRTLHSFSGSSDGGGPSPGLLLVGDTLYGVASGGGDGGGTVFAVGTNGGGFRVLHSFSRISGPLSGPHWMAYSNVDGAYPGASLVLSSNMLYGTTLRGGRLGQGTVFAVNTNGTGFTNLYSFVDGSSPTGLLLSSNSLYGIVQGTDGFRDFIDNGSVFAISTSGAGFRTVHAFAGSSDGVGPDGPLVLVDGILYGITMNGGASKNGTVFKLTPAGAFQNLHVFSALSGFTNLDGANSEAGVIFSSNLVYGTTAIGGIYSSGTIFTVKTNGTNFSVVYPFSPLAWAGSVLTNSDGAIPHGLVLSGSTLYGITEQGGMFGNGTAFSLAFLPVTAPVIVTQPQSRTNIAGTTASFRVVAKADGPLNFQWLKAAKPIPQQTESVLTLTNVSDADATAYSIVVSNAAGSVVSSSATLTVITPPRITVQPLSRTNIVGTSASFNVSVSGTTPLLYQWLKGSTPVPKQTTSTLTLSNVSSFDSAAYRVMVTNLAGSATSSAATLTVMSQSPLSLSFSGSNTALMWPNAAVPVTLQFATNLVSPILWTPVNAKPIVVGGQNVVSNTASGSQKYYRLRW